MKMNKTSDPRRLQSLPPLHPKVFILYLYCYILGPFFFTPHITHIENDPCNVPLSVVISSVCPGLRSIRTN